MRKTDPIVVEENRSRNNKTIHTIKHPPMSREECAKVFDLAMKNAGLAPPSVTESYSVSVSNYVKTNSAPVVLKTESYPQEKTDEKVS